MANALAGLTPEAEIRVLEVARETSAMIGVVTNNTEDMNVPVGRGETVDINVMNDFTTRAITPGNVSPTNAQNDINPTVNRLTLDQWKASDFILSNKEWLAIQAGKSQALDSAVRAVVNDINGSLTGLYKNVYQYSGTAGTTPFASNTGVLKDANNFLNVARSPMDMRSLVLDPFGYGNATQLNIFQPVDSSGSSETLRDAMISRGIGYDWSMDQLIATHSTNATGTYAIDASASIGATTIVVDNGAGASPTALIEGDLFTIAGSTQQYTVLTYAAGATEDTVTISPALDQAVADGDALTVIATDHVANLAFHPQAFHLAIRPESQVELGELGKNRTSRLRQSIVDEVSGIALTLEFFEEYHQTRVEVSALWGVVCARPEFAVRILG